MARAVAPSATSYTVERATLRNGLRVVLAPDRSAPVVAVAVFYDVGIRSEPEGRTGFAHLFEHLMFQGSATLEKLAHFRYVQASGGTFNGSTHLDYTDYYEALPSNALERALFLEADRMRAPAVTEENLANQIAVVKEEIRVNVLNRPYGGFPWLKLPPVMFDTFPNAHDGYGSSTTWRARPSTTPATSSTATTRRATPCSRSPATSIPRPRWPSCRSTSATCRGARPAAARLRRAGPTSERRDEHVDRLAPVPAVALGWRVPDPDDLDAYLPYVVLARCSPTATPPGCASGWCSRTGSPATSVPTWASWGTRSTCATPPPSCSRRTTPATCRATGSSPPSTRSSTGWPPAVCPGRAGAGPGPARLGAAAGPGRRAGPDPAMAAFEQQRGRPELIGELPGCSARSPGSRSRPLPGPAARCPGSARPRRGGLAMSPKGKASAPREVPGLGRPRKPRLPTVAERRAALGPARRGGPPAQRAAGAGAAADPVPPSPGRGPRPGGPARAHDAARHRRALPGRARRGAAAHRRVAAGQWRRRPAGARRASRCAAGCGGCSGCWPRCSTGAAYPKGPVEGEAARLADQLRRALSQPGVQADEAWLRQLYGAHPYGREHPSADEVRAVPGVLAARRRTVAGSCPDGSAAGAGRRPHPGPGAGPAWQPRSAAGRRRRPDHGAAASAPCSPARCCWSTGPARCSRPSGWAGRRCPAPTPTYAGAELANAGLRRLLLLPAGGEHPRGQGLHVRPAQLDRARGRLSCLLTAADVATEVTGPALVEIGYELGRMATLPPTADELAATAQYLVGIAGAVDRDPGRAGRDPVRRCWPTGWT